MQNKVTADWERIKLLKQTAAIKSNTRENSTRINHDYNVGDKVLILQYDIHAKMDQPTEGPFEIIKVHRTHGTVKIARGAYNKTIHVRRLKPFNE